MSTLAVTAFVLACSTTKQSDEPSEPAVTQPEPAEELLAFQVTGRVVGKDGVPIEDAMVMIGGQSETLTLTASDGGFSLWFEDNGLGEPAIVAAKQNHRAIGAEFFKPDIPVELVLRDIEPPDNLEYTYQDPGDGIDTMKEDCTHCHSSFVREFLTSGHAEAASNPLLQDLYAGVTRKHAQRQQCEAAGGEWREGLEPGQQSQLIEQCYLGGGVLQALNPGCDDLVSCDDPSNPEPPTEFGACADCHAPGINGIAGGRNLHDAVGIEYELGVQCDVCHKTSRIDLEAEPGVAGRMVITRPSEPGRLSFEWDPVYFGPIPDVPNVAMAGSVQPQFNEAVFCAGCHEHNQQALLPEQSLDALKWPTGLPIQSTFSEWENGPYNREGTPCQFCHMPANTELVNAVDITRFEEQSITFGFPREPEDIRRHLFRGPLDELDGDPRLIEKAAYVSIVSSESQGVLTANVSVANVGCGHALPTGEPMRSLILLVESQCEDGQLLQQIGGPTVSGRGGAWATGVLGGEASGGIFGAQVEVSADGLVLIWPDLPEQARAGMMLRQVRFQDEYLGHSGLGRFKDLPPAERGMPIHSQIAELEIGSISGTSVVLSSVLSAQDGDVFYLVDSLSSINSMLDGEAIIPLAGQPGTTFARVLVDDAGQLNVPHYKAVDMASDNRIAPGSNQQSTFSFTVPQGCSSGQLSARLFYRALPFLESESRGWEAADHWMADATEQWSSQ